MAPADPPIPPAEPASPPAPPELPPDSPPAPTQTPTTMAEDKATAPGVGAKPSAPGPVEPPGIAATVLPQRQEDAGRADDPDPSNDR